MCSGFSLTVVNHPQKQTRYFTRKCGLGEANVLFIVDGGVCDMLRAALQKPHTHAPSLHRKDSFVED